MFPINFLSLIGSWIHIMTINILYAFWILELYLFGLAFGFLISTLFLCFWYFIFHLCSFFLHHRIFFLWWSKFQQYYNTCIIVKKKLLWDFIPWKNEINNNAEEYIDFFFEDIANAVNIQWWNIFIFIIWSLFKDFCHRRHGSWRNDLFGYRSLGPAISGCRVRL